jgi:hypothetical protein
VDFSLGSKTKSTGARSGEWGGWGRTVVFVLAKKSRISSNAWTDALSWWRNQEVFLHNWGHFSWHLLLDVSALRDNTSDSMCAPDVRIHDAQHPRCKKPSTWLSRSTWPSALFRSRRIFSNLLWRLHFRFHIVSINPCFIAGYNSFQEVFILASAIQKFLTDGKATVSLILCRSNFVASKSWHDPVDMWHCSAISRAVKQLLGHTISRICTPWASSHDVEARPKRGSRVDCRPSLNRLNHS